jgi:hypothetical protein
LFSTIFAIPFYLYIDAKKQQAHHFSDISYHDIHIGISLIHTPQHEVERQGDKNQVSKLLASSFHHTKKQGADNTNQNLAHSDIWQPQSQIFPYHYKIPFQALLPSLPLIDNKKIGFNTFGGFQNKQTHDYFSIQPKGPINCLINSNKVPQIITLVKRTIMINASKGISTLKIPGKKKTTKIIRFTNKKVPQATIKIIRPKSSPDLMCFLISYFSPLISFFIIFNQLIKNKKDFLTLLEAHETSG